MNSNSASLFSPKTLIKDLTSGVIVFLVALPLCLGIALASNAPLFSGLIAGIVGGILVGILSGSQTSVTGPAAGLTAIVAAQIANLGSYEAFLLAVVIGGILQVVMGIFKAGALAAFFPSSVIKGLLAAIGVILILKQIPHLLGHDTDPEGDMAFEQPDNENTFSEVFNLFWGDIHYGALTIGLVSMAILILWEKIKPLKNSLVPAPLVVVVIGVILGRVMERLGTPWLIESSHMVQVPVANSFEEFRSFLTFPDFSQLAMPAIYIGGITIAIVASLETLLNLDAVDKLDPKQRVSPPSRELLAQGVGNITSGMLGGLPVTSVVIRGSVNIHAGAQTKLSAIVHGTLLLVCVLMLPTLLNIIPLSCLAAILLLTGFKLASPKLFKQMWAQGRYQFLPFILTLISIVLTDLLIGILIGLAISLVFILNSNLRRPIRRIKEKYVGGEVLHIELANQVSFLNRAAIESALREAPRGSRILLDARRTDYIDPDILSLIRDFKDVTAPVYDIQVSLRGFRDKYHLEDSVQFVDFASQELRDKLTPQQVQEILVEGNRRFLSGRPLDRDLKRVHDSDGNAPLPIAAILTGIDSRTPVEMIFDLGLGDAFTVRLPGNVVGPGALGGVEYACVLGGAKLIVVMGHTGSRLVTAAIEQLASPRSAEDLIGCKNLDWVLSEIQHSVDPAEAKRFTGLSAAEQTDFVNMVSRRHVVRSMQEIHDQSPSIQRLVASGQLAIVSAMYDVETSAVEFLNEHVITNTGQLLTT
ncbi:MAG: bifunctional SulP family inorganic anion transporter/carbonic anhydrase [Planctomycetaceae bacterium]